jgi:hypothetical protein
MSGLSLDVGLHSGICSAQEKDTEMKKPSFNERLAPYVLSPGVGTKKRCSCVEIDATRHAVRVYRRCTRMDNHRGVHAWGPWRKDRLPEDVRQLRQLAYRVVRASGAMHATGEVEHIAQAAAALHHYLITHRPTPPKRWEREYQEALTWTREQRNIPSTRLPIKALLKNPKTRKQILDGAVDFICKVEGIRT